MYWFDKYVYSYVCMSITYKVIIIILIIMVKINAVYLSSLSITFRHHHYQSLHHHQQYHYHRHQYHYHHHQYHHHHHHHEIEVMIYTANYACICSVYNVWLVSDVFMLAWAHFITFAIHKVQYCVYSFRQNRIHTQSARAYHPIYILIAIGWQWQWQRDE